MLQTQNAQPPRRRRRSSAAHHGRRRRRHRSAPCRWNARARSARRGASFNDDATPRDTRHTALPIWRQKAIHGIRARAAFADIYPEFLYVVGQLLQER